MNYFADITPDIDFAVPDNYMTVEEWIALD